MNCFSWYLHLLPPPPLGANHPGQNGADTACVLTLTFALPVDQSTVSCTDMLMVPFVCRARAFEKVFTQLSQGPKLILAPLDGRVASGSLLENTIDPV